MAQLEMYVAADGEYATAAEQRLAAARSEDAAASHRAGMVERIAARVGSPPGVVARQPLQWLAEQVRIEAGQDRLPDLAAVRAMVDAWSARQG